MGLDWRPMGKPKPGHEDRFNQLYRLISGAEKQSLGLLDKLKGKKLPTKEELLQEWFSIQIPSYETIKAPRVGRDKEANDWIREQYEDREDKSVSLEKFVEQYNGYYVIPLAKELDGVPVYIAMGQDENVFRGKFLDDCEDLIGNELYEAAYVTKLADETLQYGQQLMAIAEKTAAAHNATYLRDQRIPPDTIESIEFRIHILYSAAKWLIFYGKNGHGFEADY